MPPYVHNPHVAHRFVDAPCSGQLGEVFALSDWYSRNYPAWPWGRCYPPAFRNSMGTDAARAVDAARVGWAPEHGPGSMGAAMAARRRLARAGFGNARVVGHGDGYAVLVLVGSSADLALVPDSVGCVPVLTGFWGRPTSVGYDPFGPGGLGPSLGPSVGPRVGPAYDRR